MSSGCVDGRTGGALRPAPSADLSAGEATPEALQRKGRWASGKYKAYVHGHGKDGGWVVTSDGIHPGQDMERGK